MLAGGASRAPACALGAIAAGRSASWRSPSIADWRSRSSAVVARCPAPLPDRPPAAIDTCGAAAVRFCARRTSPELRFLPCAAAAQARSAVEPARANRVGHLRQIAFGLRRLDAASAGGGFVGRVGQRRSRDSAPSRGGQFGVGATAHRFARRGGLASRSAVNRLRLRGCRGAASGCGNFRGGDVAGDSGEPVALPQLLGGASNRQPANPSQRHSRPSRSTRHCPAAIGCTGPPPRWQRGRRRAAGEGGRRADLGGKRAGPSGSPAAAAAARPSLARHHG